MKPLKTVLLGASTATKKKGDTLLSLEDSYSVKDRKYR
jgi:hypothetical protein